jgi:hypothetical protein
MNFIVVNVIKQWGQTSFIAPTIWKNILTKEN